MNTTATTRGPLAVTSQDIHNALAFLKSRTGLSVGDYKIDRASLSLSRKAMKAGCRSVSEYIKKLSAPNCPDALVNDFISEFTINHTAFFRESQHYPLLIEFLKTRKDPISVWSSACSTGEEIYSIAMACEDAFGPYKASKIKLLATDIDASALEKAKQGQYSIARLNPVSQAQRERYFLKGGDDKNGYAQIKPSLRDRIEFKLLNLNNFSVRSVPQQDVIFCRNVLIYFEPHDIEVLLKKFAAILKPGGILITGHSEQLNTFRHIFTPRGQTTFTVT